MVLMCCLSTVNATDNMTDSVLGDEIAFEVDVGDDSLAKQQETESVGESQDDSDTPLSIDANIESKSILKDKENVATLGSSVSQPTKAASKIQGWTIFMGNVYIQKTNKNFNIKAMTYNEKKDIDECIKNIKLIVKIKIGNNIKTINVKTDSNGVAKVLNIKNLNKGIYKLSVTSNDARYNIKDNGLFVVYGNQAKVVTLKNTKAKRVGGDIFLAGPTASDTPNVVYADNYNAKSSSQPTHALILKAKFIFKNKKTAKTVSKSAKGKNSAHGWMNPHVSIPKGYALYETKVKYVLF